MTKEQAIDLLDNLIGFIEDSHGSDYDQALKMAIKALEQEPFINKPCVSEKVCEYDKDVVLGNIRAEIENYDNFIICANGQKGIHIDKALEIIDKYKAESEEK